ncbi:MAG: hypothetical protein L0Y58_11300 [Verrucomicrobia subdivision 3 bacterium]|nr:hypothetical protein [Limisphaerales bacterium]
MKELNGWAMRLFAGASLVIVAGCVSYERTVYEDVPRSRVEFENDRAARVFYETLSKAPPRRQSETKTEIDIPIVFEHKRRVVPGQSVAFNDAVVICDTNQDGKITELEAQIFADSRSKR